MLEVDQREKLAGPHPANRPRMLTAAAASTVLERKQMDVVMLFGIEVTGQIQLLGLPPGSPWSFISAFRMADPWAQRRLVEACDVERENLKIARRHCWIKDFRDWWLQTNGNEWPLRESDDIDWQVAQATVVNSQVSDLLLSDYLWWGTDGLLKATSLTFYLDVDADVGSDVGFAVMDAWDAYLADFNSAAEDAIKGALQTSNVWVRIEAEEVILQSTMLTVILSLCLVFFGIMVFTRSMHLAFIVLATVASIIICLFFFMVGVAGWKVGAVEVMCLIIFMGISVDYALHVAHKYHSCKIQAVEVVEEHGAVHEGDGVDTHSSPRESSVVKGRPSRPSRMSVRSSGVHSGLNVMCADDSEIVPRQRLSKDLKNMLRHDRGAERYERARYALQAIGGAVIGSALTSMGCAVFMLPCTLVIFTKIGAVVIAVTFLAIAFSVMQLPAALMIFGPCAQDGASVRRWLGRNCCPALEDSDEEDDVAVHEEHGFHYVLHMPARRISSAGPCPHATRTSILASG